ncbi:MAG TPA: heparan-alpha-glucosaminide N-acetyltransferase domain-containing protein [Flavisolibacter sp.]|nr:heparan-alpha-glucosaminide N-acetyltransferase domain-containing protein [Flavisolibacter sp.]
MEALAAAPPLKRFSKGPTTHRIDGIDLLRGLVMIVMALDHTRDFFHKTAFTDDPLNLQTTTPLLFLTRWITHFCAPVFVFLSGTSAFLQSLRKSRSELSGFLLKRGLWLIFIELAVVSLGISFDLNYSIFFLQVIWAIGISMVLLGLAIWLPFPLILAIGLLIVLGHNTLDYYEAGRKGNLPLWYSFLHSPAFVPAGDRVLGILYPFLPWTGIMMLGYCFGKIYKAEMTAGRRNKLILGMGLGLIGLFILLRWSNLYGDPKPWSVQATALHTVFSFIDTEKYPPSLLYACMTLGPALVFLSLAGNAKTRVSRVITVYGRVPFIYYILHFYILHALAMLLYFSNGHSWAEGVAGPPQYPKFLQPGEGYDLPGVYLVWASVVIALYPVCYWFSQYKRKHRKWWLSYL